MPKFISKPQLPTALAQQMVQLAAQQVDPLSVGMETIGDLLDKMTERSAESGRRKAEHEQKMETMQLKNLADIAKMEAQIKKAGITQKPFLKKGGLVQKTGFSKAQLEEEGFKDLGAVLPPGYMVKRRGRGKRPDIHIDIDKLDPEDYPEIPRKAWGQGKSILISQLTGLKRTRTKLQKSVDALKKKYAGARDNEVHREARRLFKDDMEARKDKAFAGGDMFPSIPSGAEAEKMYQETYIPRARRLIKQARSGKDPEVKVTPPEKGSAFAEWLLQP